MSWQVFNAQGQLTEQGDDATQTVTEYNPTTGAVLSTTPYTATQIQQGQAYTASATATTNYQAILTAIATQRANNTTYLGITSPTNAQVIAQVAALTRQVNALMRLAANDLTGTN